MWPIQFGKRLYVTEGWGGMSGLWAKLRGGLTRRTETAINRIKQTEATKAKDIANSPENKRILTPFDMPMPKKYTSPPQQLWMQSAYVRGSTQKMTDVARQIIGLPLDAALLQMRFSVKKKAVTVMHLLSTIKSSIMRQGGNPAYYYIKSATVGRGTYLKRLDIKGRGKFGIERRGHAFVRICCHKPDPRALVKKLLRIKKIPREDKPIMKRLDYC